MAFKPNHTQKGYALRFFYAIPNIKQSRLSPQSICSCMRKQRALMLHGRGYCLLIALFGSLFVASGCAMKSFSIDDAVPDRGNITGSVDKTKSVTADNTTLSDQKTIRNVVSALNFTQWGKTPVPWANPDTGSQGTITTIAENKTDSGLCREFETSREAFDGVVLYRGETCMKQGGDWTLTSFAPL